MLDRKNVLYFHNQNENVMELKKYSCIMSFNHKSRNFALLFANVKCIISSTKYVFPENIRLFLTLYVELLFILKVKVI